MGLNNRQERYLRNLAIPGFGARGQELLGRSSVLIAGLGGLGSPASLYLAAAGVGCIGLLDADVVEVSNLQRQVLHGEADIGREKTVSAAESIGAIDNEISLVELPARLGPENADSIIARFDAVVEATDNFSSKFLVNDACVRLGKPFATAGIFCLSGQAQFVVPGRCACLRCAMPDPPRDTSRPNPTGVLGAVPGVMGSLQAMEIIRWMAGLWTPQKDGAALLHSLDGNLMRLKTLRVPPRPTCLCGAWSNFNE